jgi:glycosyltransferase involved in cell wall biosynthesis
VRIALVVPGGVDRTGRERVIPALLWLIERLSSRHDVTVFALGQNEEPGEWDLLGARVVDLGRARRAPLPGLGVGLRIARLCRLLRRTRFDLVHAFWASPCGFLAAAAAGSRIPLVVSLAGGELAGIPEIGYGLDLVPRERAKVRWALSRAAAITAASAPIVLEARRRGFEARLVPLGVEEAGFLPPAPRAADGAYRLLHVADLNRVKDQATLLRALRRLLASGVPVRLDVAGEDTLSGAVQAEAARLGVSSAVTFRGRLATDRLRPFLRSADLLVLSSRHEAGPVAFVEAAACALPTVGTAVGHIAEGHPARAFAVPVGDDATLADAIVALLEDPERRLGMGAAALEWARANDAGATARRFEELYREVTGR